MIIDSGCICNIVSDRTWDIMQENKIQVFNQVKNPNKRLMAYGRQIRLKVLGSFESKIRVGPEIRKAVFFVIKDGTKKFIGKGHSYFSRCSKNRIRCKHY